MDNSDVQSLQALTVGWSTEEQLVIVKIQQTESVTRPEAIRWMQRRKQAFRLFAKRRSCRNPRCTRGDDLGPGSLAHLRTDALYCNGTCKKAGQRSLRGGNSTTNRQCLRGAKGDKFTSLLSPP